MFVVIALFSPQSAFAADLGTKKGNAYINWSTGGLLNATRQVYFNTDGSQTNTDKTWEVNPSGSINITYSTVGDNNAPILPDGDAGDRFLVQIFYENETGTAVQTLYDQTSAPASPTTWTFDTTSAAGTYRIFARIIGTNETLRDDYDVTTDGGGPPTDWHKGALRVSMNVTDVAVSAYPAESIFAYGTAVDESATITVTHTASRVVSNTEDVKIRIRRNSDQAEIDVGATQDAETDGTTARSFVIDNSFDAATTSYDAEIEIVGASALLTTEKWTHINTATLPVTKDSATIARYPNRFNANSSLSISGMSLGETVYNRGESSTYTFNILNTRSEQLTRTMNWSMRDSANSVRTTASGSGASYSKTYVITSTDTAANTTAGDQWNILITTSDAPTGVTADIFSVSSLIHLGTAQNSTNGNVNVAVTPAVYNRGETVSGLNFYLTNARGTAYAGKTATIAVRDDDSEVEDSQSLLSDAEGKIIFADYAVASTDKATADTTGSPKHIRVTPPDGNTAFSSNNAHSVSSLYYIDAHPELDATLNTDDWPMEDANEALTAVIAADLFSFFAHVKNVRKDVNIDTSGSAVTFTVKKPDGWHNKCDANIRYRKQRVDKQL